MGIPECIQLLSDSVLLGGTWYAALLGYALVAIAFMPILIGVFLVALAAIRVFYLHRSFFRTKQFYLYFVYLVIYVVIPIPQNEELVFIYLFGGIPFSLIALPFCLYIVFNDSKRT